MIIIHAVGTRNSRHGRIGEQANVFSEAIPNAIDSAIKGDFKEDDGSYSDKVGKFIGGLNPVGDVRDIIANGKKLIQGDGKATNTSKSIC